MFEAKGGFSASNHIEAPPHCYWTFDPPFGGSLPNQQINRSTNQLILCWYRFLRQLGQDHAALTHEVTHNIRKFVEFG